MKILFLIGEELEDINLINEMLNILKNTEKGLLTDEEIKKLLARGYEYKDIAIFYRTNAQSRVVEEGILKANLPYKVVGSFYFYSRKEIKDLICYLRLIINPHDDISLRRVINVPKRGIGDKYINDLEQKAREKNISMFDAIDDNKGNIENLDNSVATLNSLFNVLKNKMDTKNNLLIIQNKTKI